MSETIRIFRKHLSEWQIAYILVSCMILSTICPYIHGELKGYAEFSDIKGIDVLRMFFWCLGSAAMTIVAFMTKNKKGEGKPEDKPVDFTTINK